MTGFGGLGLDLLPKYVTTFWDFLTCRPRKFWNALSAKSERYLAPWPYSLANLGAAAATYLAVASSNRKVFDGISVEQTTAVMIVLLTAGAFALVVPCAKAAGFLLNREVRLSRLVSAFAYSSGLLIPVVGCATLAVVVRGGPDADLNLSSVLLVIGPQLLYCAYLISAAARANYLDERPFVSFIVLTSVMLFLIQAIVFTPLLLLMSPPRRHEIMQWNVSRADRPLLSVGNETAYPGCSTCWKNAGDVRAGDIFSVNVSYHQSTIRTTSHDTRIRLFVPESFSGTAPIGCEIWSSESAHRRTDIATVRVDTIAPIRLKLFGSKWFPFHRNEEAKALYQPMRKVLTDSGLSLGDVPPGIDAQGDLVFFFRAEEDHGTPSVRLQPVGDAGDYPGVPQPSTDLTTLSIADARDDRRWTSFMDGAMVGDTVIFLISYENESGGVLNDVQAQLSFKHLPAQILVAARVSSDRTQPHVGTNRIHLTATPQYVNEHLVYKSATLFDNDSLQSQPFNASGIADGVPLGTMRPGKIVRLRVEYVLAGDAPTTSNAATTRP
jgi:hypothetical protein